MPTDPALNSRSGGSKMIDLAATLCRLVNVSAPAIRARYPSRTDLLALLTACEAVCTLVPAAQQEEYDANVADAPAFDFPDGTPYPGEIAP